MQSIRILVNNKYNKISAFTLVELLIVIGIISVLAVALLVTINPTEAQRRARDSQRLKDANLIQTMLESRLNDGLGDICTAVGGCDSTEGTAGTSGINAQTCGSANWLATDVCDFLKTVPVDPANNQTRRCAATLGGAATPTAACVMRYKLIMTNGTYEFAFMVESEANRLKAVGDTSWGDTEADDDWVQLSNSNAAIFTSYNQIALD